MLYDIHRDEAHKPRGRASDVSTISTCFSVCYDLLPTPPPNLCENGLGVSLLCTCVAFSFFSKLNRFFRKNYVLNYLLNYVLTKKSNT